MKNKRFLKRLQTTSLGSAMADIALLLLIFFMATTSTEPPKGVDVDLPKAITKGAEQDSLYLTIGKKGNIYFDGMKTSKMELNDLLVMRKGEVEKSVALTADKDLDYSVISDVLEILRNNEFLNIVFMSIPNKKENGAQ